MSVKRRVVVEVILIKNKRETKMFSNALQRVNRHMLINSRQNTLFMAQYSKFDFASKKESMQAKVAREGAKQGKQSKDE